MAKLNDDGLPIDPKEQKLRDLTVLVASKIDGTLGGMGFAVLLWDKSEAGFLSYASNGNREDVRAEMVDHLVRTESFEERVERLGIAREK